MTPFDRQSRSLAVASSLQRRIRIPFPLPPIGTNSQIARHGVSGLHGLGLTFDFPDSSQIDSFLSDQFANSETVDQFVSQSGIGSGRAEADLIVPVQNRLLYQLDLITDQIRTGHNPSVSTLESLYAQVVVLANNFITFVLSPRFVDRRASGQALNTVMPYIDGTCGYAVPLSATATPTQFNCISWGDGTIGGIGTNGMLGALSRAILALGGSTTGGGVITGGGTDGGGGGGTVTAGFSTPMMVALGIGVLYFFSKRRG